jgi:hypothetical protein
VVARKAEDGHTSQREGRRSGHVWKKRHTHLISSSSARQLSLGAPRFTLPISHHDGSVCYVVLGVSAAAVMFGPNRVADGCSVRIYEFIPRHTTLQALGRELAALQSTLEQPCLSASVRSFTGPTSTADDCARPKLR